jgi:hypothetical protein
MGCLIISVLHFNLFWTLVRKFVTQGTSLLTQIKTIGELVSQTESCWCLTFENEIMLSMQDAKLKYFDSKDEISF